MSIPYVHIARSIALRARQLPGGDVTAREAAYNISSIVGTLNGVEMPFTACKDIVLMTEQRLAMRIAMSSNKLWRRHLASASAAIASGADIPRVNAGGVAFIGTHEGIYDSATGRPLTEQPLQIVQNYLRSAATHTFFKRQPYHFAEHGTKSFFTVANAIYRGCAWDYNTQATQFNTANSTPVARNYTQVNVSVAANTITYVAHGYFNGLRVRISSATPPAPLVENTDYFLGVLDADTLRFHLTFSDSIYGINPINLTANGSAFGGTILPQDNVTGGSSPLPQECADLWVCECLAFMPQEGWLVQEAEYYKNLAADKAGDVIAGRATLELPSMPAQTASAEPNKD